jgi:hypothetical protein
MKPPLWTLLLKNHGGYHLNFFDCCEVIPGLRIWIRIKVNIQKLQMLKQSRGGPWTFTMEGLEVQSGALEGL